MNGGEQFGIMNIPGGDNKLLYTPVTIEGVDALALVDSGASTMFIADRFVKEHASNSTRSRVLSREERDLNWQIA